MCCPYPFWRCTLHLWTSLCLSSVLTHYESSHSLLGANSLSLYIIVIGTYPILCLLSTCGQQPGNCNITTCFVETIISSGGNYIASFNMLHALANERESCCYNNILNTIILNRWATTIATCRYVGLNKIDDTVISLSFSLSIEANKPVIIFIYWSLYLSI